MQRKIDEIRQLTGEIADYARERSEHGASGVGVGLERVHGILKRELAALRGLPDDPERRKREPEGLEEIRMLRPASRRAAVKLKKPELLSRMAGALNGRLAGCTLGAIVEMNSIDDMQSHARYDKMEFPPRDYWRSSGMPPWHLRYSFSPGMGYTRDGMDGVPVDDDIVYTQLGLLILEECGRDFSTADVGRMWLKYLPYACTAEDVALRNLKNGVPAERAAELDNPYWDWIGADIRSDAWGYAAAGNPELAAEWAWRDARISHRGNGVYGEMFFSAAIAAAFAAEWPLDAVEAGLGEIPEECDLARTIRWALANAAGIRDYREAREAVDARFPGMSNVHTLNNAALTVFGLAIGGRDFSRVIGETVAMGLDNDCTAATAGSIAGAVVGAENIPAHWTHRFHDRSYSYLNGIESFSISDMIARFAKLAF